MRPAPLSRSRFGPAVGLAAAAVASWPALADDVAGLSVTPIEHAAMVLDCAGTTVLVDPGNRGDYSWVVPDVVLVTHTHRDHFLPAAIPLAAETIVVGPAEVGEEMRTEAGAGQVLVIGYDETVTVAGWEITAVPAYNDFHPYGEENGYVVLCGGLRLYISGDTSFIPDLPPIDIAFLSVQEPFSLTVDEAVTVATEIIRPGVAVPYHFRGEEIDRFQDAVEAAGIPVRILDWY